MELKLINNKKLYTVRELSQLFKCEDQTIRKMIKAGKLSPLRFGKRILIREDDIEKQLKGDNN